MKIVFTSKESIDIEYEGKVARFSGELGIVGFRAKADSMKWVTPQNDNSISPAERKRWIDEINRYYVKSKDRIFFLDSNGKEII